MTKRFGGAWIVIALILLIPVAALVSIELIQRQRYDSLNRELAAALKEFSHRSECIGDSEFRYRLAVPPEKPIVTFSVQFQIPDTDFGESRLWTLTPAGIDPRSDPEPANVILLVAQERKLLLLRNEITLRFPLDLLHPSVTQRLEDILNAHGLSYRVIKD